jgi:hypothetical protein
MSFVVLSGWGSSRLTLSGFRKLDWSSEASGRDLFMVLCDLRMEWDDEKVQNIYAFSNEHT